MRWSKKAVLELTASAKAISNLSVYLLAPHGVEQKVRMTMNSCKARVQKYERMREKTKKVET